MTEQRPDGIATGRVEAFSDGVFAIAITLLIIEIEVPHGGPDLGAQLLALWPSYVAYVVSFLLIGVIWLNHHTMFSHFRQVDQWLLVLNMLLLLDVAFLPFPTAVLAEAFSAGEGQQIAAALYGGTLVIGGLIFNAIWWYASSNHRHLGGHITPEQARAMRTRFLVGPVLYAVATVVGLFNGMASVGLYALLLIFFMFENRPRAGSGSAPVEAGRTGG